MSFFFCALAGMLSLTSRRRLSQRPIDGHEPGGYSSRQINIQNEREIMSDNLTAEAFLFQQLIRMKKN
jgi:hypothetical protein